MELLKYTSAYFAMNVSEIAECHVALALSAFRDGSTSIEDAVFLDKLYQTSVKFSLLFLELH